ncbi:MAG TPA: hypothetical protein VD931_17670 [Baekduia sp.]|nr:hypothetical protein [Baekduia sp.]
MTFTPWTTNMKGPPPEAVTHVTGTRFVTCPDCAGNGYKVTRSALSRKYEARECESCGGSGRLEVKKP